MARVAFICAGAGIEELGPVQAEHFLTCRAGRLALDGLVLLPVAHDLSEFAHRSINGSSIHEPLVFFSPICRAMVFMHLHFTGPVFSGYAPLE